MTEIYLQPCTETEVSCQKLSAHLQNGKQKNTQ